MKYKDVPILMYHDVGLSTTQWCVSETSFKAQMMLLKRKGYRTIGLDELKEGVENGRDVVGKAVVLTFDDARRGVYSIAYPILRELGFMATIYIVPRWVEGEEIPREELYSGFLNWNQLRDLALAGWGMGSHSLRHQNLTSLPTEQLMRELQEADGMILRQTMQRVQSFCYPYGKYDEKVLNVINSNYKTAVTIEKGFGREIGRYGRQWVLHETSLELFEQLLHRPTLSIAMIVKNEEQFLEDCLKSVKRIADEIIVVDTGSIDKTKEIALNAGAAVYDFNWGDDFAAARNAAIGYCTSDWVFIIDADEVIATEDYSLLLQAMNLREVMGYQMVTKNYSNTSSVSGWVAQSLSDKYGQGFNGWYPSTKVRLFQRKPEVEFRGAVHEMVDSSILDVKGKIMPLPVMVHHYGERRSVESSDIKRREYLKLTQQKIEQNPKNGKAYFELGIQYKELKEFGRAEEMLRRAIEFGEGDKSVVPLLNLAVVLQKLGKFDLAIGEYEKVINRVVDNAEAHFGLGFCAVQQQDLVRAKKEFELAIQYKENYLDAMINLGAVYEKMELYPDAITMLVKVLKLNQTNGRAYYNLGVVYEKVFAIDKAILCYKKAIELRYARAEELRGKVVKMERFLKEEKEGKKS